VLVGEVRDAETAKLALEASMTGHMVMTTLHTNSSPAAITRLVEMGIEPFLVASSLSLVVAQRLVRRVCEACATAYRPPSRVMTMLGLSDEDLATATPRRGSGCPQCGGTGYYGRTGVFEVLPVTASLRQVLMTTPTEAAIDEAARKAGMQTLRASALVKARAGITTYEEVLRTTHIDDTEGASCSACGGAIREGMRACPWCAATIFDDACSSCRKQLEPAWRLCPWCRAPVAGRTSVAGEGAGRTGLPSLLVIDDDESILSYVKTALADVVDVDTAATASAGLDLIGSKTYDGALIDQRLPDLTGLEVIRLLRADAHSAALPVMLFTGEITEDLEGAALEAGVNGYLLKPVDPTLLEERVVALVGMSSRSAA
jgi:CheY-like chemotaxis protein